MNFRHMFVMGDRHGNFAETEYMIKRKLRECEAARITDPEMRDVFFVAGDAGFLWYNTDRSANALGHLNNLLIELNAIMCIVPGNHENYDMIAALPIVEFQGAIAREAKSNIYYLESGHIYFFNDKKIFVYGGADSVDKEYRAENISWWRAEIPSPRVEMFALENLEKHDNRVDIVITHTAPKAVVPNNHYKLDFPTCPVSRFLGEVLMQIDYDRWFCGHFHRDADAPCGFRFLYHTMAEI